MFGPVESNSTRRRELQQVRLGETQFSLLCSIFKLIVPNFVQLVHDVAFSNTNCVESDCSSKEKNAPGQIGRHSILSAAVLNFFDEKRLDLPSQISSSQMKAAIFHFLIEKNMLNFIEDRIMMLWKNMSKLCAFSCNGKM